MTLKNIDTYKFKKIHWEITDVIKYMDGKEEIKKYQNTIMSDISKLITCLMKKESGYLGISYWAVGSGISDWDSNLPEPDVSTHQLVSEYYRKSIPSENIVFLDDNNEITESITNKIQITLDFLPDEANGELREMALFGGDASSTTNSGIMLNHKIHPLISKTTGTQLTRIIICQF